MDDSQLLRYSRHLLLDEIGVAGQEKIINAHALIIGAGGLGSPAALYLTSAGIGKLTLCDPDQVELTNLQRQLLHDTESLGQAKVFSAQERLYEVNPYVTVVPIQARVGVAELTRLVADVDVVLDCSDNFATRHAVNRVCVRAKKPLVSGAAVRFDGQISVFDLRNPDAPCYHCLFGEGEELEEIRCATLGVFAPAVGVIGALQAVEALKLLTDAGEPLVGRLLIFDALKTSCREVKFSKDPHCSVCANAAHLR